MIKYYFDIHVFGPVYHALKDLGVDIIRGQDDGRDETEDIELLRRASELERVLVTGDKDFLSIAADFQRRGEFFQGIVYYKPMNVNLKNMIDDLELIAKVSEKPEEMSNLITFLPLR